MNERPIVPRSHVVFRPLVENLTNPIQQRVLGAQRMVDLGDHVEWTDEKSTRKWRLPDQAGNGVDYPVMTTVVFGETHNPIAPGGVAGYHLVFTDAAGVVLGRVRSRLTLDVPYTMFPALGPDAFEPLVRRGVTLTREDVTGLRSFYRAHPDPSVRMFPWFRRKPRS